MTRAASGSDVRLVEELDGLRAVAILSVFAYHLAPFISAQLPYLRYPLRVLSNGWMGVDLFFVLSGFLITGGLLDTRAAQLLPELFHQTNHTNIPGLLRFSFGGRHIFYLLSQVTRHLSRAV